MSPLLPTNQGYRFGFGAQNLVDKNFSWGVAGEYVYGGTADVNKQANLPVALGGRGNLVGSYQQREHLFPVGQRQLEILNTRSVHPAKKTSVGTMKSGLLLAVLLVTACAPAAAQGTIYESQGKDGPVFSDTPSPGAKPVVVSPPNLSQGVKPQPPAATAAAMPSYSSLAIASPANEGTVHSNTGAFNVRVRIAPALRSDAGDRMRIRLDGNLLASSHKSGKLHITAADWNGAANPDNVAHTLQAAIVDRNGAVLLESAPVTFYAHRATVRSSKR